VRTEQPGCRTSVASAAGPWKDRFVSAGFEAAPVAATAAHAKKHRLWPWISILVIGTILVPIGIGAFAASTINALLGGTAVQTPTTIIVHCDPGTYYVFADVNDFTGSPDAPLVISAGDVTVTSPGGRPVGTYQTSGSETRISSGITFEGVVGFHANVAGRYAVRIASPAGVAVLVAPSLGTSVSRAVGWLIIVPIGAVLFILGLVMVIVRSVQRSKRKTAPVWAPRCANGHPVGPTDKFCGTCGAPVVVPAQQVTR